MALSSLVEIVQRAADELGLARPTAVAAGTSAEARQLFACANAAGRDLMRAHDWGALRTSTTFTTVSGTANYDLATDYDRMVPDTAWNRTSRWMLVGPDSPQVNRWLNDSATAQASVRQRFIINGTRVNVWPTPTAAETVGYLYVSNKWARSSAAVAQTEFQADTDTSVFDPDLVKAELKWRFMAAKGMNADALKTEAMVLRDQRIAFDIGGTKLSLSPEPAAQFIELDQVADSSWSL